MGVEPQFSGWEIGSPPRASFLIPPPGAWVRVRQQRGEGEEEEAVAAAGGVPLVDSRPCPPRRGQACKDPRGVNATLV